MQNSCDVPEEDENPWSSPEAYQRGLEKAKKAEKQRYEKLNNKEKYQEDLWKIQREEEENIKHQTKEDLYEMFKRTIQQGSKLKDFLKLKGTNVNGIILKEYMIRKIYYEIKPGWLQKFAKLFD